MMQRLTLAVLMAAEEQERGHITDHAEIHHHVTVIRHLYQGLDITARLGFHCGLIKERRTQAEPRTSALLGDEQAETEMAELAESQRTWHLLGELQPQAKAGAGRP
jgi:hypothetical protein